MIQIESSSPSAPRRKRRALSLWKIVLGIIVVLMLAHGVVVLYLGQQYHAAVKALKAQGLPVSTAELTRAKVPDDQNGAFLFMKAFNLLDDKQNKKAVDLLETFLSQQSVGAHNNRFPPVSWTDAKQASRQLAGVVPLTQQALSQPSCQFTTNWAIDDVAKFRYYSKLRSLEKVLTADAVIDTHDGRMDEAYRKIDLAFRTAQVLKNEPNIMCILVTTANTGISYGALQSVLQYGTPDRTQATKLNRLLVDTNFDHNMAYALRGERATQLSEFDRMTKHGLYDYFVSPGTSNGVNDKRMNGWALSYIVRPLIYMDAISYIRAMNETIAIAEKHYPNAELQQKALSKLESSIPRYAFMTKFLFPVFPTAIVKTHLTRARAALTQILLAAQQYKVSHGQYPDTMAQVRSAGITGIPMDPLSGKDFVYKRTAKGFTVYSVGDDFKDDGGKQIDNRWGHDHSGDIVLKWER